MKHKSFLFLIVVSALLLNPSSLFSQTFTDSGISLPGVSNGDVDWGDYDNDGDYDILLCGNTTGNNFVLKIFRNEGGNTFSDQPIFSPAVPTITQSYSRTNAEWVDFDSDSFLDIVFITTADQTNKLNSLIIYRNQGDNTFILKKTIKYFNLDGHSFDCGDIDNDGDQDILLATSTNTRIYQNLGDFKFEHLSSVNINGKNNGRARLIDYNNDGYLDIFITGETTSNTYFQEIYANNKNNSFTLQDRLPLSYINWGSMDWSDYDSDGLLDLAFSGSGCIFKQNSLNKFLAVYSNLPIVRDGEAKWGDLDNDGDPDLVYSGWINDASSKIFLNNGNDSFSELTGTGLLNCDNSSIELFDFDKDNDLDIVISGNKTGDAQTKIYINNTTTTNLIPAAPSGLTSSIVGDNIILKWNAEKNDNTASKSLFYNVTVGSATGYSDIVNPYSSQTGGTLNKSSYSGNAQLDTFFILRNIRKGEYYWNVQAVDNSFKGGHFATGTYSFKYTASIPSSGLVVTKKEGGSATLGWTRGNGQNSIVFLKAGNTGFANPVNQTSYDSSSVFMNGSQVGSSGWYCVAKGNLSAVEITGLSPDTDYIFQVVEYDGDSGEEIYSPQTSADNLLVFKTSGFTHVRSINLAPVTSMQYEQTGRNFWIDFDKDDDLDILIQGTYDTKLYRNDSSETFTLIPLPILNWEPLVCADFNNDGLVDISITGNPTKILKNLGNMNFTVLPSYTLPGPSQDGSLDWADYDLDGDVDLLMTGRSDSENRITKIFRNNGDETFTEQNSIILKGLSYGSCDWIDYNNDGLFDILLSGIDNDFSNITLLYKNLGNNKFAEQKNTLFYGSQLGNIDHGDYDNDGFIDIMITGQSMIDQRSAIYHNNGDGSFNELEGTIPQIILGTGSWGDYDNDGDLDILLAGYEEWYKSPITKIYKNNGNGFSEDLNAVLPGVGTGAASWGDYDNDGDLDILISGNTADEPISRIYRNDAGFTTNIKPTAPLSISSSVYKSDVTLTWRQVTTDKTPFKSITYNLRVGTTPGGVDVVSPLSNPSGKRMVVETGNLQDTIASLKKLPLGTYYWSVQAIDNSFAGSEFSIEESFTIVPVQASNLRARIVDDNSILLKWERGNGDRCAIFSKQISNESASPVDNVSYTADGQYGYGSLLGTSGWYCVYDGRTDTTIITGLVPGKPYSFQIFEYMGGTGTNKYFRQVADGNPGVFSTGLFTEQTGITLNNTTTNHLSWGDYDNDGFIDMANPGFPSRIFRNNGDNTFTEKTGIALSNITKGCSAWGDYDSDGDLDLIITGSTNFSYDQPAPFTKIYRNDGSDIFTGQDQIILPQLYYSSASWCDYDKDGDIDLLLTGAQQPYPVYNLVSKIFENDEGSFSENLKVILPGAGAGSGSWIDYNNDGFYDIAISGYLNPQQSSNAIFKVFRNNGDKTFTDQTEMVLDFYQYAHNSWGDFDNDGDPDLTLTGFGSLSLYMNLGNTLSYQFSPWVKASGGISHASWGDYNNDGYLDFILSELNTKIFHNTHGRGIVSDENPSKWFVKLENSVLQGIAYGNVCWGDYDNDGDLDLLVGRDNVTTKIFRNNTIMRSGSFIPNKQPLAPAGIKSEKTPAGILLKWNPVKGDETSYKTMSYNIAIGTSKTSFNICSPNSLPDGYRLIPEIGNTGLDTVQLFKNLAEGKYYWKVQAVDQSFKGGLFSAIDSFEVRTVSAFFSSDEVCQGLSTHFINNSVATSGISSFKWDFGDGEFSSDQNPVHHFKESGNQIVKLVITANNGAKDSLTHAVVVKPKPIASFTAPSVCQGTPVTAINTTDVNSLTIESWKWDFGDTGAGNNSTLQQPAPHSYPYLVAKDYSIKLKAVASNGCADSVSQVVSVGSYPVAAISANAPLTFCSGDSVTLTVPLVSGYTYDWKLSETSITGANTNKYIADYSGDFSVEITNPKGNCTTLSPSVTVTMKERPPSPVIVTENYQAGKCSSDGTITIRTEQEAQGYSYSWKRNGTLLPNYTSSSITDFIPEGDYTLVVTYNGCPSEPSAQKNIIYANAPLKPRLYVQGPVVWYMAASNDTAAKYRWYRNDQLIQGADKFIYLANKTLGTYKVAIGNSEGCFTMSDPVTIPVSKGEMTSFKIPSELKTAENIDPFENIKIYPNPTPGLFTIEMDNKITGELNIDIFSQEGRKILNIKFEKTTDHFRSEIDLSGQAKGMYIIDILLENSVATRKLMVD